VRRTLKITDETVQDYIDGRMDERERAAFAAHLLANPDDAELVADLLHQNDMLKGVGANILDEPVPERLAAIVREAGRRSVEKEPASSSRPENHSTRRFSPGLRPWAIAASLVLMLASGVLGWYARDYVDPPITGEDIILASGLDAYRLYGSDGGFPVEFSTDRIDDLTQWLDKSFKAKIRPPALDDSGYSLVGGRVLPYASGNYGFFLFEKPDKSRVAVICWPRGERVQAPRRFSPGKDYASSYFNKDRFGFAVYAQSSNGDFDKIVDSVSKFYDTLFEAK
jgi:anti-sigma factor RsiW